MTVTPGSTYDGLDKRALASLTGASAVVIKSAVSSTLDVAHALGQGGAASGLLVLAEAQHAGRGRQGRVWLSPRGGGIWMSVLLRPRLPPSGGSLAIRAGLATVEALAAVAPALAPRLRWPNDIMVANAKAGGVLCEARWNGDTLSWVAVGIGINVRGPVPPAVEGKAIAIGDVVPGIARTAVLAELVPRIIALARADGPLGEEERARFMQLVWRVSGETITGLAADGALLVRRADGTLERRTDAD